MSLLVAIGALAVWVAYQPSDLYNFVESQKKVRGLCVLNEERACTRCDVIEHLLTFAYTRSLRPLPMSCRLWRTSTQARCWATLRTTRCLHACPPALAAGRATMASMVRRGYEWEGEERGRPAPARHCHVFSCPCSLALLPPHDPRHPLCVGGNPYGGRSSVVPDLASLEKKLMEEEEISASAVEDSNAAAAASDAAAEGDDAEAAPAARAADDNATSSGEGGASGNVHVNADGTVSH